MKGGMTPHMRQKQVQEPQAPLALDAAVAAAWEEYQAAAAASHAAWVRMDARRRARRERGDGFYRRGIPGWAEYSALCERTDAALATYRRMIINSYRF